MDTSKHFFQRHGVNAAEKVVLRKKLRRKEMVVFFEALAPTVIAWLGVVPRQNSTGG
jgi:transposase